MEILIGETLGGCTIESKIGQGGMGTVYRAHHQALDIPVAIKILHTLTHSGVSEERFLREAQITARLRHPNIVGVMNAGVEKGVHFIIMEYVEGCNLQTLIDREGKVSVDKAVSITIDILHALETALEQGIVHRDIKPENILIDNSGNAKLADLGLARVTGGANLTQSNTMLGSPHYIAPEQADDPSAVDSRSDIYSLGCTLFHMISGKAPFLGNTLIEIVMNHIQKPVPRLREVDKNVPDYISDIVFTMMQKDPARRYANPSEAINALESREKKLTAANTMTNSPLNHPIEFKKQYIIFGIAGMVILLLVVLRLMYFQNVNSAASIEPVSLVDTLVQQKDTLPEVRKDSLTTAKKTTPQKVKVAVVESPSTTKSISPENPLIAAVKIGDTESVKSLLAKGTSPNGGPASATTPLHEAVRRGLTVETQMLLVAGANTDARDKNGSTALHYAIKENASLMVKLLLDKGANPNIKDPSGKTPLQLAKSIDSELEKILEKNGAK